MSKLSENAFATMAICDKHNKPYGITVDKVRKGQYKFVWAFKISADKAHREGFDAMHVSGAIDLDPEYPGCPYCKSKQFIVCSNCGTVSCYHGARSFTCPGCHASGEVTAAESFDLRGGGY